MNVRHSLPYASLEAALIAPLAASAQSGKTRAEVVCAYAPSQTKAVMALTGTARGANVALIGILASTGIRAVAHSSGAYILSGTSGYIGGTLGAAAAVPVILTVTFVVSGALTTLELVCASKNHPDQVAKVHAAAEDFSRRFSQAMQAAETVARKTTASIVPYVGRATIGAKKMSCEVFAYASRSTQDLTSRLSK